MVTEIYTLEKDGYFARGASQSTYRGSYGFLHRIVWMEKKGSIPKGMSVHHIDGDRENNVIENLELMWHDDHTRHHRLHQKPYPKTCPECGRAFESRAHNAIFCNNAHMQRYNWNAKRGRR